MTGLEKIIKEIDDEAAGEAGAIIVKAKAEAEKILAAAKEESAKTVAEIEKNTTEDIAGITRAKESAALLQRRQYTLRVKQGLLADTLLKAQQSLYSLPAEEYFTLLIRLTVGSAASGEGVLYLNERDLGRVPSGFEADLNAALPDGKTLKVSDSTRDIDGGVVLAYGGVEENCSFDAVFNARRDDFSDLIRGILFA